MTEFETNVRNISCVCEVDYYYPGSNFRIGADSDSPNDEPEFEFTINDHKGNPIPWINNTLTDEDKARIFDEFLEHAAEYAFDAA
jgi:hypothetical protein|tara:strand:- start:1381 stop:1635 length:255 start_codon:yes stop_codon:yes gene_type:complete